MLCEQPLSDPTRRDWAPDKRSPDVLVGVMITPPGAKTGFPAGKKSRLFREMVVAGKKRNVSMYFFYPGAANPIKKRVAGFEWTGKRWVTRSFPLPDIVYNRILSRSAEQSRPVSTLLKRLQQMDEVILFNTRFLDKWEVYQAMTRSGLPLNRVPETALLSRAAIKDFVNRYRSVFLKPRDGSLGAGIVKISRARDTGFIYERTGTDRGKYVRSADQLYQRLLALSFRPARYLVQEGVDLQTYRGSVFDIRCQVQKNGQGKWVFTGAGVRVAARGRFVTHVPNGGKRAVFDEVIGEIYGHSTRIRKEYSERLEEVTLTTARILERELGLHLAILSMDVGLDRSGEFKIIEVNSKPAIFDEKEIRYRHLAYLCDYFLYLGTRQGQGNGV
jgi:hypothetical protein